MDTPKKIKWHNGLVFPSLEEGREALIQHTLDQGESFRVVKADHKRFFTCCNSGPECRYQIRLYVRRDTTAARVQLYKPKHTCSPDTHQGWVPPQYGPVNDEQPAPIQPESHQPETTVPTPNGNDHTQVGDHPDVEAVESTQQDKPKKSKKNKKNKKGVLSEEIPPQIVEETLDAVIESTPDEKPKKKKKNKKGVPSKELPSQTADPAAAAVIEVAPQEQPKQSKKNKKNAQSEEVPPQIAEHPVDMAELASEEQPKKSKNKKDKKSKQAKKAAEEDAVYDKLVTDMERNKREYADDKKKITNWANHVAEQESSAWADLVQEGEPTTYEKGLQTRREVLGNAHVDRSLAANSNAFSRPMQEVVTEFAWGNIWNREGLSRQQRSLMNIALLTALNRSPELAVHVRGAINNGLSELEIREAIIHSTVYCGAPAGMEAARTAERVLSEMQASGEHQRQLV